ncbi:MAG: peptidylprolyl isomerase [Methanobacteriota archaeon]
MGNSKAVFDTSKGKFTIELFEDKAPLTTDNFIKLAKKGFYNGVVFHRVIPEFMVQCGCPYGTGTGGPGYTIRDEFIKGLSNVRGTMAMANTGRPNTGGSQFFINLVDNTFLDFDKEPVSSRHPVFGKVTEGMNVVDEIAAVKRDGQDKPFVDVVINTVTIVGP